MSTHILFVDDEPSIRLTLPAILEQHGYQVTTAATVADALRIIGSQRLDVLIADLNIGEPGDGFTVVSAMRRTQPTCRNFILTGYPAFESALKAIRQQVDDFFVKPADIRALVEAIGVKLRSPHSAQQLQQQTLAGLLREQTDEIVSRTLDAMRSHPRLSVVPLSDKERENQLTKVVRQLADLLESKTPEQPASKHLKAAAEHGATRRHQRYSPILLVDDMRVLGKAIYTVVQENLLNLKLSDLIPDLCRVNDSLEAQLQAALEAFITKDAA